MRLPASLSDVLDNDLDDEVASVQTRIAVVVVQRVLLGQGQMQRKDCSYLVETNLAADAQWVMQVVRSSLGAAGQQSGAMPTLRHGGRREDG